jgi:hypothetical protein
MAKKKFFETALRSVGMLGMVLVLGMAVSGCDTGSPGGGDPKIITITDFVVQSVVGEATYSVRLGYDGISGIGILSGNSLTAPLKTANGSDWTGTGSDWLRIEMQDTEGRIGWIYSEGDIERLNLSMQDYVQLPKISITETTTTISFSMFEDDARVSN